MTLDNALDVRRKVFDLLLSSGMSEDEALAASSAAVAGAGTKQTTNGAGRSEDEELLYQAFLPDPKTGKQSLTKRAAAVRKLGVIPVHERAEVLGYKNAHDIEAPRTDADGKVSRNPFRKASFNLSEIGRLKRTQPNLYASLKAAAERAGDCGYAG